MRTNKRQLFYDFADSAEVKILEDTLRKEDKNELDLNLIGCFFKQVTLIDQMSRLLGSLMKRLYEGFKVEVLKKDEFVFEQGYQDECLYVILKGNAQSYEKRDMNSEKHRYKQTQEEYRSQLDNLEGDRGKDECIITNIDKTNDKSTINDSKRVNSIKQQQELENEVRNLVYQPELQQEFTLRRDNRLDKEVREMLRERSKVIVEKRKQEELWKNLRESTVAQMKLKSIVKKMMTKKDEVATKKDFFSGSKIMMKRFLWKSTDPKLKLKQQEGLNGLGISATKKEISQQSLRKSSSNSSTLLNSQLFSRRTSRIQQSIVSQADQQPLQQGLNLFGNQIIEEQELEIMDENGMNNAKEEEPFRQLKIGEFQWAAGEVFGEEALKTRGFCREYSVAASSEELRVAILSRETFEEVLFCFYEEELNKEISFLGSCSLFSNFNEQELEQILLKLVQVTCEKDAILFKEGDVPEKLFLVREGDVLLDQELESSKDTGNVENKEYLYASSFHPQKKKRHKIAIIGPGQIFGDSELLKGCKERTTRAKALNATCKFYTFDLDQIKFLQDNSELKDTLMEARQNKSSWRARRKINCSVATEQDDTIPFLTLPRDNMQLLDKRKHYEILQESQTRKAFQNELTITGQNVNLAQNSKNIFAAKCPKIKQKLNFPKTCTEKIRSSKFNYSVDSHRQRNSTSNTTAHSTIEDSKTLWTPQNQQTQHQNNSLDLYSVEPISPFFLHLSTEGNPSLASYSPKEHKFYKKKAACSLTQQDMSFSPRTTRFKTTCTEVSPRKQQQMFHNSVPSKNQLLHPRELSEGSLNSSNKVTPRRYCRENTLRNQSIEFQSTFLTSHENSQQNHNLSQQQSVSPRKRIIPRILSCIKPNSNQSLERISIQDQQNLKEKQIQIQQEELFDSLNPIKERAEALANTARIINSNQEGNPKKAKRMFIYENEELEKLFRKSLIKPKQKQKKLVQEVLQTQKEINKPKEIITNQLQNESPLPSSPRKDGQRQMSQSEKAQLRELVKQNTLGEISYLKDQKRIEMSTNIKETMNEQQTPRYRLKSMKQILESYNQIQNFSYLNKLDSFLTLKQQIFPSQ